MNDQEHHWLKQGSASANEIKAAYDTWAESYDETVDRWDYRSPGKAAKMLRSAMPEDATILDAGCGTGLTGLALRAAGFTGPIDGFDLSPDSLSVAEKRNVYRTLTPVDLQELPLPFADGSYDMLLCVGVMTYVPDGEGALREFARVVRPSGRILITQRDDVFRERDYGEMFGRLSDVVSDVSFTEPLPYMPNNPDFGEEIKVIYAMMAVR